MDTLNTLLDKIKPSFDKSLDFLKKASKNTGKWLMKGLTFENKLNSLAVYGGLSCLATKAAVCAYTKYTSKTFKDKYDINKNALETLTNELSDSYKGCRVYGYVVDITKRKTIDKTYERMLKKFGPDFFVSALINNAGIVVKKTVFDMTEKEIIKTMRVNTISHFWMIRKFVPEMIKRDEGHLVCISSGAGVAGIAGLNTYCASKFAVFGLTESIRLQLKRDRVNVDTLIVCPYFINTGDQGMFAGVNTILPLPLLKPEYVAKRVIRGMKNRTNFIMLPKWLQYLNYGIRFMVPTWMQDEVQRSLGLLESMTPILQVEGKDQEKKEDLLDTSISSVRTEEPED